MQGNSRHQISESIDILQNATKAFNSACEEECYRNILAHPNPVEMAIRQLTFSSIKLTKYKDKKSTYEEYRIKNKTERIIPSKLNEFAIIHEKRCLFSSRQYKALNERLNQLLAYRLAKSSRYWATPKKLLHSYYVHQAIKEEESGKTPLSNTRLLKDLQNIVDALLFVDNGSGNNKIKMYTQDIIFLINFCPNVDLLKKKIRLPKTETFESMVAFLIYRHLDGERRFDTKINGLVKRYDFRYTKKTKPSSESAMENSQAKGLNAELVHSHQTTRSSFSSTFEKPYTLPSGRDAMRTN